MKPNFAEFTKETTSATDLATIPLLGAVPGFESFALSFPVNRSRTDIPVSVRDPATGKFETGLYTLTSDALLTRQLVYNSSNGGQAETFAAGTKEVNCTVPAWLLARMPITQTVGFSTTLPLTSPGTAFMLEHAVSSALNFTIMAGAVQGAFVNVRLVADGDPQHAVTVTGAVEAANSAGYDNRAGAVNPLWAWHDGYQAFYSYLPALNPLASTVATVPATMQAPVITAGDGSISIAWVAPADGGSAILDVTFTASTGQTATGSTSPTVMAVPNGTAVFVTGKARNAIGSAVTASPASNSVTPAAGTGGGTGGGAVAYNYSGYNGNAPLLNANASAWATSAGKRGGYDGNTFVFPNSQNYFVVTGVVSGVAPTSAKAGWGLSATEPPASITASQNAPGNVQNGLVPAAIPYPTIVGVQTNLWVDPGSSGPWFFWIEPVDGVAHCMNAGAGLMVTGA